MIPSCLSNTNLTNVSKLSETMENVLKVLRSFGKPMLRPCPYYTPEEFDNGGFTLRTQQMFSVHTTPEEFKTQQSPAILDLLCQENHMIIVTLSFFKMLRFRIVFRPHELMRRRRFHFPPV